MTIQLIDSLDQKQNPAVAWQIDQVKQGLADELWLASPHENAVGICQELGLSLDKVVDMASQKRLSELPEGKGFFLFDLKVPNQGQLVFQKDGTVGMVAEGRLLGTIVLFAGYSYRIQAISWLNPAGDVSRKDIYQANGALFARQYFNRGALLESDFYFGEDSPRVLDYYFNGRRNYSLVFGQRYPSFEAGLQDFADEQVNGREIVVTDTTRLATLSTNMTLACPQSVFDEAGNLNPDVLMMIENAEHPVKKVLLSKKDFDRVSALGHESAKLNSTEF